MHKLITVCLRTRTIALAMFVMGVVGCEEPTTPDPPDLLLQLTTTVMEFGQVQQAIPMLRDSSGRLLLDLDGSITWSSTDETVARVDSEGFIKATGVGRTTIVAEHGGQEAIANLEVIPLRFESVSPGRGVTCARTYDGVGYCWGDNDSGSLGNGGFEWDTVPEPIAGGHRFISIGTYRSHACGVDTDGRAHCWGTNAAGSLGTDETTVVTVHPQPVAVSTGLRFASVGVGDFFSCALTTEGHAYCWGSNRLGSLGIGGVVDRRGTPTAVAGDHEFTTISVGHRHACGLTAPGHAYCWGSNVVGQLGDGTTGDRYEPTPVLGDHVFTSIKAGVLSTCGITGDGAALCWGTNYRGTLGDGTTADRLVPTPVAGNFIFETIAVRTLGGCGLTMTEETVCWGSNLVGEIGQPPTAIDYSDSPIALQGGYRFTEIAGRGSHMCGKGDDQKWYCWGSNSRGQLGIGEFSLGSWLPLPIIGQ